MESIVPETAVLNKDEVVVYEFDETEGTITRLPDYNGIPSDNNYLNRSLSDGNELFDELLEIEEEL